MASFKPMKISITGCLFATCLVATTTVYGNQAHAAECLSPGSDGPMEITVDCEDPIYNERTFAIDKVSEVTTPMPHTRVDGHFTAPSGKETHKVTFYLPPPEIWQGRFFQNAYPLPQPENLDNLTFALRNGAMLVNSAGVMCGCDGYRPDAAAAKIARRHAREFYKTDRRIYGYVWGGSGGGLLTSGAAEHTSGVWDGIVPYVMPNSASLANVNAIDSMAGLALADRLAGIADAAAPGSESGPFAGLAADQQVILEEVLALGKPLSTFANPGPFGGGSNPLLMVLTAGVKQNDPTYVEDFWSKPGYAGANPPAWLRQAIKEEWATVTEVKRDGDGMVTSVTLDRAIPIGTVPLAGMAFEYWLYAPDGRAKIGELGGRLEGNKIDMSGGTAGATGQLGLGIEALMQRASLGAAEHVAPGQKVKVNNLNFLALHFYHRHAMPLDRDMYPYDWLRNPEGSPRYPQRSYLAAPESAVSTAGGGRQTGLIKTRVIVMQSMDDSGAQPWMADWYARRVRAALGPKQAGNRFRVWFNENAGHLDTAPPGAAAASMVNYVPALHQAVLDLVAWAERGIAPPRSSGYSVSGGQVRLAQTAAARRGIQPVVELTANGKDRIEVAVNQPVTFIGRITAPPGAGKIVTTAWWFGEEAVALAPHNIVAPARSVSTSQSHTYNRPGTYFVTLQATLQRKGDAGAAQTLIQNLDRVRVIVR